MCLSLRAGVRSAEDREAARAAHWALQQWLDAAAVRYAARRGPTDSFAARDH